MNNTTGGWLIFVAAIGMMCTLLAADVASLGQWHDVLAPKFVALELAHLGAVIGAFIGGKLIPVDRDPTDRTRSTDGGKL